MAETTQLKFTYEELVSAMIKQQGLHEGLWGILMEFAIQGANAEIGPDRTLPAAIVPVVSIGLQRIEPAGKKVPGTVDAAVVNPRT